MIQELLQSEIPADIAMGLFLLHKEGKLYKQTFLTRCKSIFTVQFDNFSCWSNGSGLSVVEAADFRFMDINEFDFRTK